MRSEHGAGIGKRGVSTLVLERCALPRYKSCSGMIIAKTAQLVERYFDVCIPDGVKCTPYDNWGMVFVADDGKEYKISPKTVSTCGAVNLIIGF